MTILSRTPAMDPLDLAILISLPILLILSAFFSGSETALFAMTENERMQLRTRRGGSARSQFTARAVDSLLREPRMLLITVLLGNMIVNVTYFVISSVLLLRIEPGAVGGMLLAISTLLGIILLGEVLPKMAANAHRTGFAALAAPPLLAIHNIIGPIRIVLDRVIVSPLARLTSPSGVPQQLDQDELAALLDSSSRRGDIDPEEQRVLREVVNMSRLRVRDVMTPRVRMAAIPISAARREIIATASRTGRRSLPVYADDLDTVLGVLDVRSWLLRARAAATQDETSRKRSVPLRQFLRQPHFVPHLATLDQLLEHFRRTHTRSAIVVDEFGGTAGVVSVEDVVERLVGELGEIESTDIATPRMIGFNEWEVDGNMSVHDWADAFGQRLASPKVATLGGLIIDKLGRAPTEGDIVHLGNVELKVVQIDRARVARAIVRLKSSKPPASSQGETAHDA